MGGAFHYYSLWGDTAMPDGLNARLCHAFLVVFLWLFLLVWFCFLGHGQEISWEGRFQKCVERDVKPKPSRRQSSIIGRGLCGGELVTVIRALCFYSSSFYRCCVMHVCRVCVQCQLPPPPPLLLPLAGRWRLHYVIWLASRFQRQRCNAPSILGIAACTYSYVKESFREKKVVLKSETALRI